MSAIPVCPPSSWKPADRPLPATLLFVDDEPAIRQFCRQEMEAAGYQVHLAADGVEAVSFMLGRAIDLVILDRHMPRCCGLEAARHIKQRWPTLPVILFTADLDYLGFRNGVIDACVVKSENLQTLRATVELLLQRHPRDTSVNPTPPPSSERPVCQ